MTAMTHKNENYDTKVKKRYQCQVWNILFIEAVSIPNSPLFPSRSRRLLDQTINRILRAKDTKSLQNNNCSETSIGAHAYHWLIRGHLAVVLLHTLKHK